jgi:hypothetical protein
MPDRILHKRNLTSGNIPTTSSLLPGELAINVADGLLFLRQSGSIADTIINVGLSSSFSQTASYAVSASSLISGSITTKVSTDPSQLFLIKSGSTTYLNISSSGDTDLYSNLFVIRNFTTKQPVLTVTQSIVQFATQSVDPIGTAPNGGIWFTSASFYVGIDN